MARKGRRLRAVGRRRAFLAGIEHRRTQVGSPETNGFCERFHRTVKEESFSAALRCTFYESMDELQRDLDEYLEFYIGGALTIRSVGFRSTPNRAGYLWLSSL